MEAGMGLAVDSVSEVLRLAASTIEPAPEIATSAGSEYIREVAKLEDRLLILLDLSKIFSNGERTASSQM
jgi:purine-binding chemotaxis protein CheW